MSSRRKGTSLCLEIARGRAVPAEITQVPETTSVLACRSGCSLVSGEEPGPDYPILVASLGVISRLTRDGPVIRC